MKELKLSDQISLVKVDSTILHIEEDMVKHFDESDTHYYSILYNVPKHEIDMFVMG